MAAQRYRLDYLASVLEAELVGDKSYEVDSIAALENATASSLSFVASDKYLKTLLVTNAGAVVLQADHQKEFAGNKIIVANPYLSYAKLSRVFEVRIKRTPGIHPTAVVSKTARISSTAAIGPNCVIGENVIVGDDTEVYPGCVIGDGSSLGNNCLLHANVTIYADVKIGDRTIIHSGTVIGSDGFGFAPTDAGWVKIHQLGGVTIGSDVEIGASTAIDRGALTDTVIEDGVIIDNQVHIAHNVHIGSGTAIAGCVGIAGSTTIGKNCTVAGAVAINGHISIADNSHFHGGTIVTKGNTEPGTFASTPPLQELKKWRRTSVRYTQLEDWVDKIKALEKRVPKS